MSREDNWQFKFSQICQDIRDIKSNSYSSNKINNWKMTITPTQLGSTSILDNHKPPDPYNYGEGEKDDTYSPYKPVQDQTKDYNSDNQANCETPISGKSSTPPPHILYAAEVPCSISNSKKSAMAALFNLSKCREGRHRCPERVALTERYLGVWRCGPDWGGRGGGVSKGRLQPAGDGGGGGGRRTP